MTHSYAPYASNMVDADPVLVAALLPNQELIERSWAVVRECWGGTETETWVEFVNGGSVVHFEMNSFDGYHAPSVQTIYYNQDNYPCRVIHNGTVVR